MLLTQSTAPVIGWIATLLGFVMEFIFRVLSSMGIENIGLCIIFFTIFVRIILLPLMVSQQRFQKITQAMQPEISKIQKKYRNKKDQASMQKQNEEIQAVYDKYGTSATGGCAQLLVQMPVLLALYQVIRKVPAYIPQVKIEYMNIVNAITGVAGYEKGVNKVITALGSNYVKQIDAKSSADFIIDQMNYFNQGSWQALSKAFPSVSGIIDSASSHIVSMNNFVAGINISVTPGFKPSIYWIIPILAGLFQYLSAKTMTTPQNDDNPGAGMTKSMTTVMPLMSVYFCLIMPVGLGLYWIMSAVLQLVQQVVLNKYFDSKDLDELVAKNREKAAKKKAKGKKSLMERLSPDPTASGQDQEGVVRTVDPLRTIRGNAAIKTKNMPNPNEGMASVEYSKRGDVGKGAYAVEEYNKQHATKGGNQ